MFALLHFLCLARNPVGGAPAAADPTKRLAELEIFTFFAEKQRMGHLYVISSCGARCMASSAARLVDEVLPHEPLRQWGLSVLFLADSEPKAL